MTTCPACFTVRSAIGACNCDETQVSSTAVLERPVAPPKTATDPRELVADGDLKNVQRVTRALMDFYNLDQVELAWNNSKRRIGTTYTRWGQTDAYKIELSRPLFEHMNAEQRMNTITHEIAHALVGCSHNHNEVWRRKHIELGGDGNVCNLLNLSEEAESAIYKWTGKCPAGHTTHRAARSAKMFTLSCGKCTSAYDSRFKYTWTQNY